MTEAARSWLILGGARSGKTQRALEIGAGFAERWYVATAEALDDEMAARIAHHRAERGGVWRTVEAPLALAEAIAAIGAEGGGGAAGEGRACVVDCLTLWLSNLMAAGRDADAAAEGLCAAVARAAAAGVTVVMVSNEVGLGLVPETPLGRAFRDHQGRLNQRVARAVACAEFIAAGLPIRLKG